MCMLSVNPTPSRIYRQKDHMFVNGNTYWLAYGHHNLTEIILISFDSFIERLEVCFFWLIFHSCHVLALLMNTESNNDFVC